jgi:alkanesulfonate monooxygenase SsuD/methylene tetrahydromethanopterin reductase-like flavin-dependent oxidoreductase (luciferase family)
MRLGISITSDHAGRTGTEAVSAVIERAQASARAGLDHLSLGDHHAVGPSGNYVQNVPMIGRIMADWPSDKPIGLLLLLPLWSPVLAAEQIGTLASMTQARFIVQTGIGWGDGSFAAMGVPSERKGARTEAAIEVMKRLFAGETVTDEEFGVRDASINPRPPRPVEWWIGSGSGDRPLDRAARVGDVWYVSPRMSHAELASSVVRYRQRCADHGTTPRVALRRDVFVADDDAEALALGQRLTAAGYRGLPADVLVYGGVERVVEMLAPLAELGVDDIVARTMDVPPSQAVRSIELLGRVREQLAQVRG